MGQQEENFVLQAFESNWIAPLGPHVNEFERDLESYNGVKHAVALSSGTSAIHVALTLEDIGPKDVVFCQSFTFCGSANPIFYAGSNAVFIDSEPDTWNMDPDLLEQAIEDTLASDEGLTPKVIIPVHLYGMPAKMDRINAIASKYNMIVVEDAAESLGSTFMGKKTGSWGDYGIYSFNGNKIITTSGGGALVTSKPEKAKEALHLATQARDEAPHYEHSKIGFNYRMSNVLAGIGRGQMRVLDLRVKQRRANFQRYVTFFENWNNLGLNIRFQIEKSDSHSNRWLTAILVDPANNMGLSREDIRKHLLKHKIEARPLWKPMHQQPVFKGVKYYGRGVSDYLFENGLCLPSGSNLTDDNFDRIFEALSELFKMKLRQQKKQLSSEF